MKLSNTWMALLLILHLFSALPGDAQSLSFEIRLSDGRRYSGTYPEAPPRQTLPQRPGRVGQGGGDFNSAYYKGCVSFGDGTRCNLMSSAQAGRAQRELAQGSAERVQSYEAQLNTQLAALDRQIQQLAAGQRPSEGSPAARELARLGGVKAEAHRQFENAKLAFARAESESDARSGERARAVTPVDGPEFNYQPEHTYEDPTANAALQRYQAAASKAAGRIDARPYITAPDSEWGQKVDAAARYVRRAEGVVAQMPADSSQRSLYHPTLAMARDSVLLGDESFAAGAIEDGEAYLEVAYALADIAMGFVPGVGWSKDLYESIAGTNLLTGQQLSDTERSFAVLGVLTAGVGSKLANFGKMANLLRRFSKAEALRDAEKISEAIVGAEKTLDDAKRFGYRNAEEARDFAKKLKPSPDSNFTNVLYPRGPGASSGAVPDGYTKVSRWIGDGEVKLWHDGGGTRIPPNIRNQLGGCMSQSQGLQGQAKAV